MGEKLCLFPFTYPTPTPTPIPHQPSYTLIPPPATDSISHPILPPHPLSNPPIHHIHPLTTDIHPSIYLPSIHSPPIHLFHHPSHLSIHPFILFIHQFRYPPLTHPIHLSIWQTFINYPLCSRTCNIDLGHTLLRYGSFFQEPLYRICKRYTIKSTHTHKTKLN